MPFQENENEIQNANCLIQVSKSQIEELLHKKATEKLGLINNKVSFLQRTLDFKNQTQVWSFDISKLGELKHVS